MITTERRDLFRQRRDAMGAHRPAALTLERKLLELGGEAVVFLPFNDHRFEEIAVHGQEWHFQTPQRRGAGLPIWRVPGEPSECHGTSAALWWRSRGRVQLVTGWALSPDGLWRRHSWCIGVECIIETTPSERLRYFGIALGPGEAFMFAGEVGVPAVVRLAKRQAPPPKWFL